MVAERYHPRFANDLGEACDYYDSIAHALGDRRRSDGSAAILEARRSSDFLT
jgi:hypothetical protein